MRRMITITLALAAATPQLAFSQAPATATATAPASVLEAWASAFNECSAEKLASLYHPAATLWGTNSTLLIGAPEGVRTYFNRACGAQPPIRVTFGQTVVRMHGDYATVAGTYDFAREGTVYPSRYSFALVSANGTWRIVAHHSSPLPTHP